jgi:hypothetical protein
VQSAIVAGACAPDFFLASISTPTPVTILCCALHCFVTLCACSALLAIRLAAVLLLLLAAWSQQRFMAEHPLAA